MSWERNKLGKFSNRQRHRIAGMVLQDGRSRQDVGEQVKCTAQTVGYIVKQAKKEGWVEARPKQPKVATSRTPPEAPAEAPPERKPNVVSVRSEEVDYYRWVAFGALAKVSGESFVDRLVNDLKDDRLSYGQ